MQKILRNILTSKVYEVAVETPLEPAVNLQKRLGCPVLLKREDLQPVFSFKIRGAYNRIAHLDEAERARGVIAASAGNHAQGVAFSARRLGISATIVMPATTPQIKVDAVRSMGAEVVLYGDSYSEAADHCMQLVASSGRVFIHPFNDELVVAGQGTVADEILRQSSGNIGAVFVPVGGGGLISGMAAYIKALRPDIRVIGVQPKDSAAMTMSCREGRRVELDSVGIFADGVAVRKVGELTYRACRDYVDDFVLVDTDEICSAIKAIYQDTRSIVEPAGALGVAGMVRYATEHDLSGSPLVAVNSGANMNFERLRYVAERTQIGEGQEALFAVTIPEQPGSLKRFCQEVVGDRNITEFNYRLASRAEAQIFVGISVRSAEERFAFARDLEKAGFQNIDLTDNDLAKTHVRYMVGGRSEAAEDEVLFRFWFPERPGALGRFLSAMGQNWNISLFHYRMQGGDFGRVLVGLEIPAAEKNQLGPFLRQLGYRYLEETGNPAYRLFL